MKSGRPPALPPAPGSSEISGCHVSYTPLQISDFLRPPLVRPYLWVWGSYSGGPLARNSTSEVQSSRCPSCMVD